VEKKLGAQGKDSVITNDLAGAVDWILRQP